MLLLKQVPDQPLLLVQAPAAWGGSGTGAREGRRPEVLLGVERAPGRWPLQGGMAVGSGEVGLTLGEGAPRRRGREGSMPWGTWVGVLGDPPGRGDGHSYHTRPGQPAAPALTRAPASCSSDWVLGRPLLSAGLGNAGGWPRGQVQGGVRRQGKRPPEAQSDTSRLCGRLEKLGQVMRAWGQGLASWAGALGHEAKIPGWASPPLVMRVGAGWRGRTSGAALVSHGQQGGDRRRYCHFLGGRLIC